MQTEACSLTPRRMDVGERRPIAFSICTLVTRPQEYAEMVATFQRNGFGEADCEFLYFETAGRTASMPISAIITS